MGDKILTASPNWYCSRVSDCTEEGVYAFGARSSVYLLDVSVEPPAHLGYFRGHSDKVIGVSLSHHKEYQGLCCSGAEDGGVILWHTKTKQIEKQHNFHKVPHQYHFSWYTILKNLTVR